MTIKDGLYLFTAMPRNGAGDEVRGVLIFHDGIIHGGDSFVYYIGTYECTSDRNWHGKDHKPRAHPDDSTDVGSRSTDRIYRHVQR
jgi:hypothetical protein